MTRTFVALLVVACVFTAVQAQFGEWLMDDPHKADRLPIWRQLLGNRGFRYSARANTNQFPLYTNSRKSNKLSGNTGNSLVNTLQNLYRIALWGQLLGNKNIASRAARVTPPPPPRVTNSNRPGRTSGQNLSNQLRNFYTMTLWNQLLSNQSGSSQNAN